MSSYKIIISAVLYFSIIASNHGIVLAEDTSIEAFRAYQNYSRNWLNMDAKAIARDNFHSPAHINKASITTSDATVIEENYKTNFTVLRKNDYWYSEEKLSFCKQSDTVYQVFNHYNRYKTNGSLLQGDLAATYLMEKQHGLWKFIYLSSINSKWMNYGCDEYHNYEFLPKDQKFRDSVSSRWDGEFIHLDDGYTYYEQANKEAEKHIVLVHGFSVPSYIWEPTYQEAIQRGYGVIRYDTFGRGFSDNPDLDYSTEFFAKQLINLLDALALKKVHLVGLSDGGRTVAYIAAHFPDRIDQLIFVAPAGFHTDEAIKENTVTPQEIENFINEAYQNIGKGQLSDFYAPERFTEWATRYNGLLKYQGFARAMLSTRKNYQAMSPLHQTLFENKTKTSFMWGAHDSVLPLKEVRTKIQNLLPEARLFVFDESGHLPHMEEEEKFNRILFEQILQ